MAERNKRTDRKRELMDLYDATARTYDNRYKDIQYRKYQHLKRLVGKKDSILDVGCGTGLLLCLLGSKSNPSIGVDISLKMLRVALKKLKKREANVGLVRADADSLPFRDEAFAEVTSFTVLQNIIHPQTAIKEVARVMKKGGDLVLSSLKKKHDLVDLERMITLANSNLRIESEWDDNEEDIGVSATKLI